MDKIIENIVDELSQGFARFEAKRDEGKSGAMTSWELFLEDSDGKPSSEEVEFVLKTYSDQITKLKDSIKNCKQEIEFCEKTIEEIREVQKEINELL